MRQDILRRLAAQSAAQQTVVVPDPVVKSPPSPVVQYRTETRQVPVTRQVKRCNGRRCWYETVTEYVTQTVRIPVLTSPAKPVAASVEPKVANLPTVAPAKLDLMTVTDLQPTPQVVVEAMLAVLDPPSSAKLFDLGCGDGRFLITAAKHYGCTCVGIELNPESIELARRNAEAEFVAPLIVTFQGDVRDYDLQQAQYVTLYLYPELMAEVVPKLKPGTRIVSYLHEIPGVECESHEVMVGDDTHTFFVGTTR